jgi:hypothetical protein
VAASLRASRSRASACCFASAIICAASFCAASSHPFGWKQPNPEFVEPSDFLPYAEPHDRGLHDLMQENAKTLPCGQTSRIMVQAHKIFNIFHQDCHFFFDTCENGACSSSGIHTKNKTFFLNTLVLNKKLSYTQ